LLWSSIALAMGSGGAGKRLTVLSHLMHLRDSMGVKGSHLLVCQPEAIAAWTSELNRWCPLE
ncbi:DEAD/DEAH box helicase family protein, partial [Klebsiella aerogenes]|uniref:hypothetical protein n=1 Tax=Klebsiella aerogenes TaxID=548 RepID=UPI0019539E30